MESKENVRDRDFYSEWKNKKEDKIAKLDIKLVTVLQGNKTITFRTDKHN